MTPDPRSLHDHPLPFCGQGCPAYGDVLAKYPPKAATPTPEHERAANAGMSIGDWEAHVRERSTAMTPNPSCPTCQGSGEFMGGDEWHPCPRCSLERRTLVRRRSDSSRADVLKGERSSFEGEWVDRGN